MFNEYIKPLQKTGSSFPLIRSKYSYKNIVFVMIKLYCECHNFVPFLGSWRQLQLISAHKDQACKTPKQAPYPEKWRKRRIVIHIITCIRSEKINSNFFFLSQFLFKFLASVYRYSWIFNDVMCSWKFYIDNCAV